VAVEFGRGGKGMISLELAKKLKSAGLVWDQKIGDCCCFTNRITGEEKFPYFVNRAPVGMFYDVDYFWLPSLSQLLADIEARGYSWE